MRNSHQNSCKNKTKIVQNLHKDGQDEFSQVKPSSTRATFKAQNLAEINTDYTGFSTVLPSINAVSNTSQKKSSTMVLNDPVNAVRYKSVIRPRKDSL